MSSNPLFQKDALPLFKDIKAEHMIPALTADIEALTEGFKTFESELSSSSESCASNTFESVIERSESLQYPLGFSWGVMGHLMGVQNSDELRAAHSEMQPKVIELYQKFGQSQAVYKALTGLKQASVWSGLDEAQRRIVDSSLRDMKHAGVGLSDTEREKFNALKLEASELGTKFSNNVLDSTKAFKVELTNPSDVDGLPESAKAAAAQQAEKNGHAGATAETGPWVITLDMPSYLPAMQHLKSRELRERLYRAYVTRASSGDHDNVPLITRTLEIKKELSSMLGYPDYATMSLASKMAPSAASVTDLSEMLLAQAMPAAQKEMEELREFARGRGFAEELSLWDVPFWSERLREASYEYEEEELRAYFPLPSVLNGLFQLIERLFDVKVVEAAGQAQVWHDDVTFWHINDAATGTHIASFYLDPYSRPAEKRGGAWMDVCINKSRVMDKKPTAYLTCNGTPPVGSKPSLMTFREVETLFHETGHGLQHMLTQIPYGDAAGINGVEWDAVELPSQFMENWCYDKPTLYSFAKHYETGEPLPLDLFEKVKAAKNFQAGLGTIRQLFFGTMDMTLHSSAYDASKQSIFDVQHELAARFTAIPPLPDDRFLCSFSHIFAGGYSAGYYSYKWAEVMSADAFAAFEEVGLDNEDSVRATGRRFRETVLSMGGGKHPSDVFNAFRGRPEPSPEALLRHTGLIAAK